MNKLKTIGLSALAGSLAVATASNAVEYSLTGDAYVSYSSEDSTTTDTASGKHFAADMDLYTNASTELDNGFTWDYFMELDPDGTAEGGSALNDDTSFAVTTPYGVVKACASECGLGAHGAFSQNAYAWITDTAYAEGKTEPVNISTYSNMQYHTPADLLPFSTVFKAAYAPSGSKVLKSANSSNTAKSTTISNTTQYRVTTVPMDGLELNASYTEQDGGDVSGATDEQKSESGTVVVEYAVGSFKIGAGKSWIAPQIANVTGSGTTTVEHTKNNTYAGSSLPDSGERCRSSLQGGA